VSGLLATAAVLGVGRAVLLLLPVSRLPMYWRVAFAALAGFAVIDLIVQALLLSGVGSPAVLKGTAWPLVTIGIASLATHGHPRRSSALLKRIAAHKLVSAVLAAVFIVNLAAALAPSTKIDEIFYHMLVPKRILQDGGLRYYLLPIEASITPQMHYQIALSLVHAAGAPEAGNVLSFSFSIVLFVFLFGLMRQVTENERLALMAAAACVIGESATVLYTTSGAHALGDLALVVAAAGVLCPETIAPISSPRYYVALLTLASVIAASAKLSMWPVCAILTILVVWRGSKIGSANTLISQVSVAQLAWIAAGTWVILQGPLLVWTFAKSGSPWGPVFANVLRPSVFPPEMVKVLEQMRIINQPSARVFLPYFVAGVTPIFIIAFAWLGWKALTGCKECMWVTALLALQLSLIAWKLPYEFRFLGGLQYLAVIAAVISLSAAAKNRFNRSVSFGIKHIAQGPAWVFLALTIPWLLFQVYYARPFLSVVSGLTTRKAFLNRYVALYGDFQALDRLLPADASLYIVGRIGNFYAPRRVILTPMDLHDANPVYRLTLSSSRSAEPIDRYRELSCDETAYKDTHAVTITFRTPWRDPIRGEMVIQRCAVGAVH